MNFEAFTAAGGQGSFEVYTLAPGVNGHMLIVRQDLWGPAVETYLGR